MNSIKYTKIYFNILYHESGERIIINHTFAFLSVGMQAGAGSSEICLLNIDFKENVPGTNKPERWFLGEIGYTVKREEKTDNSDYFVKIYSGSPQKGDFGMVLNYIPIEMIKGKTVTFTGRVKTEDVRNGYAGLWCGINQPYGPMDFAGWDKQGVDGTSD